MSKESGYLEEILKDWNAMVAMLRKLEWSVPGTYNSCPCCREEQGHSHATDCPLDAILTKVGR